MKKPKLLILIILGGLFIFMTTKIVLKFKNGVDLTKRKFELSSIDAKINEVFKNYGIEPLITSTYDSIHMPTSYHYKHLAEDLRLPSVINPLLDDKKIVADLKDKIGFPYDIVLEGDHIHIEYDEIKYLASQENNKWTG